MTAIYLTQTGGILGPFAQILGLIMNWIYEFLYTMGVPNIGGAIILFTIIIYMLMMPLTIKQQKFSKLSAKMNPEIQAIQKKYKNKKDNESMMLMNEETKVVYEKYGTSPTGGCLQLIIQMPILFALYKVIYNIPAYVTKVKEIFDPVVTSILSSSQAQTIIQEMGEKKAISPEKYDYTQANTIVDVLNKFTTSDWDSLMSQLPNLTSVIETTKTSIIDINTFMGINMADSPSTHIFSASILIPILAALSQWLNTKLMPQPAPTGNDTDNPMMNSMKTMNTVMPIMSAVFCFTLPSAMGLYWIIGAVVRSIIQIIINKHMDKVDIDELIKKNVEKANKKKNKKGLPSQAVTNAAKVNTRNLEETKSSKSGISEEEKKEKLNKAAEYYNSGSSKPGSLASKANMVKNYNEKNNK